jgi:hypothetical protein
MRMKSAAPSKPTDQSRRPGHPRKMRCSIPINLNKGGVAVANTSANDSAADLTWDGHTMICLRSRQRIAGASK